MVDIFILLLKEEKFSALSCLQDKNAIILIKMNLSAGV